MANNLSNNYGKKCLDSAKTSTTDAIKTASKRPIQKTSEATVDLIGNKIPHKTTSVSKNSPKDLQNDSIEASQKIYISPEKWRRIIKELILV